MKCALLKLCLTISFSARSTKHWYHIKTLEPVNQPFPETFFELVNAKVAGNVIPIAELLVYLVSGIQKLIYHAVKAGAVAFLIFGFQTDIAQADIERYRLEPL